MNRRAAGIQGRDSRWRELQCAQAQSSERNERKWSMWTKRARAKGGRAKVKYWTAARFSTPRRDFELHLVSIGNLLTFKWGHI